MTRRKLRVALVDAPEALQVFTTSALATGMVLVPELQEIDHRDLVVELCAPAGAPAPAKLASALRRHVPGCELLSVWDDADPGSAARPAAGSQAAAATLTDIVLAPVDDGAPAAARRAVDSGVPTAAWCCSGHDSGDPDLHPGWLLAVPVPSARAEVPAVALSYRRGYTMRFSTGDAAAVRRVAQHVPAGARVGGTRALVG